MQVATCVASRIADDEVQRTESQGQALGIRAQRPEATCGGRPQRPTNGQASRSRCG